MGEFSSIPKKKMCPLGSFEDLWVYKVFCFQHPVFVSF